MNLIIIILKDMACLNNQYKSRRFESALKYAKQKKNIEKAQSARIAAVNRRLENKLD